MPQINFWVSDIEANLYTYLAYKDDRKRSDYIAKMLRTLHANQLNKIEDGSLVIPRVIDPPKPKPPKPVPPNPVVVPTPAPVVQKPTPKPEPAGIFRAKENEIPQDDDDSHVPIGRVSPRGNKIY